MLCGCPREETPPAAQAPPTAERDDTAALRKAAQQEALERLVPLATEVAALEDPLTAAFRDGKPPGLPPLSPGQRATLRTALEAAEREAKGLSPRALEPADRVVAIAAQFTLSRARDTYLEQRPWLQDPTWLTAEIDAVVSAVEQSTRNDGTCTACDGVFDALVGTLGSLDPLRTPSRATVDAAAEDARSLAGRIRALAGTAASRDAAADALEAHAAALEAHGDASGPARLGPKVLQRRLEVEENLSQSPTELFTSLGSAVAALASVAAKHPVASPGEPSPLTEARCEAVWTALRSGLEAHPSLDTSDVSCASFVAGMGEVSLTDAALQVALADTAVVTRLRRQAQNALPPVLASIGGRVARSGQAHSLRAALLLTSPVLEPGAALALRDELDAACLAAAALWVHGELGDDAALQTRLAKYCPEETGHYTARAEARPRQALGGLTLARVSQGPAGVVSLDRLWWLPLGLIDDVAMPPVDVDTPPAVEARIEELAPPDPGAPAP